MMSDDFHVVSDHYLIISENNSMESADIIKKTDDYWMKSDD